MSWPVSAALLWILVSFKVSFLLSMFGHLANGVQCLHQMVRSYSSPCFCSVLLLSHVICCRDHFTSFRWILRSLFLITSCRPKICATFKPASPSLSIKMHFLVSSIALLACSNGFASAGLLDWISSRAISPDNTCGKNGTGGGADGYTCPPALPCCSANGFCGSTNDFCLTTAGCQSAFGNCTAPSAGTISPDMTCGLTGAGTAGYTCPSDASCCSGA